MYKKIDVRQKQLLVVILWFFGFIFKKPDDDSRFSCLESSSPWRAVGKMKEPGGEDVSGWRGGFVTTSSPLAVRASCLLPFLVGGHD